MSGLCVKIAVRRRQRFDAHRESCSHRHIWRLCPLGRNFLRGMAPGPAQLSLWDLPCSGPVAHNLHGQSVKIVVILWPLFGPFALLRLFSAGSLSYHRPIIVGSLPHMSLSSLCGCICGLVVPDGAFKHRRFWTPFAATCLT